MEGPSNVRELDSWYNGLSVGEKEILRKSLQNRTFKCWNQLKQDHLDLSWKPELSDDPTLYKYEESESGLFYECPNILEYLQDCRYRQERVTSEVIKDFELIHKTKKQKLFLWVSDVYQDIITEFSKALREFLQDKSKRVSISTDIFEDKYIIITNVVVDNYTQKTELLTEFKSTLSPELAAPLAVYFDNKPEPYEKLPSIANVGYLNTTAINLVSNGYRVNAALVSQIKDIVASHVGDRKYVNITINIGCMNITNNYGTKPESDYAKFVEHILVDKPEWYTPNTWLPKSILVEKFNERFGKSISSNLFMRNMNSEELMKNISTEEKRARYGGKIQRVFLTKNI